MITSTNRNYSETNESYFRSKFLQARPNKLNNLTRLALVAACLLIRETAGVFDIGSSLGGLGAFGGSSRTAKIPESATCSLCGYADSYSLELLRACKHCEWTGRRDKQKKMKWPCLDKDEQCTHCEGTGRHYVCNKYQRPRCVLRAITDEETFGNYKELANDEGFQKMFKFQAGFFNYYKNFAKSGKLPEDVKKTILEYCSRCQSTGKIWLKERTDCVRDSSFCGYHWHSCYKWCDNSECKRVEAAKAKKAAKDAAAKNAKKSSGCFSTNTSSFDGPQTTCRCGKRTVQKTYTYGFTCDVCGKDKIPKGTPMLTCLKCKWCACVGCGDPVRRRRLQDLTGHRLISRLLREEKRA